MKRTVAEVTHIGDDYGTITITEFTPGKSGEKCTDYEIARSLALKLQTALQQLEPPAKF